MYSKLTDIGPKVDRQLSGGLTSKAAIVVTAYLEHLHGDGMSVARAAAPPVWLVLSENMSLSPTCYE